MNETLWDFTGMDPKEIQSIFRNAAIEWCQKRSDLNHINFNENWIINKYDELGVYVRFTTPALSEYLPDRTEPAPGSIANAWKWHDYLYEIDFGGKTINMRLTVNAFDGQDATTIDKFRKLDEFGNRHTFDQYYNNHQGNYIQIWSTDGIGLTRFKCKNEVFLYLYESWDVLLDKEKRFLESI